MARTIMLAGLTSFMVAVLGTWLTTTLLLPHHVAAQGVRPPHEGAMVGTAMDRVRAFQGPGSAASLELFDLSEQAVVRIEIADRHGTLDQGYVLRAPSGVPIMRLGTIGNHPVLPPLMHSANLILRDDTGTDRIRLLIADDGTPSLELIGTTESLIWTAP